MATTAMEALGGRKVASFFIGMAAGAMIGVTLMCCIIVGGRND